MRMGTLLSIGGCVAEIFDKTIRPSYVRICLLACWCPFFSFFWVQRHDINVAVLGRARADGAKRRSFGVCRCVNQP